MVTGIMKTEDGYFVHLSYVGEKNDYQKSLGRLLSFAEGFGCAKGFRGEITELIDLRKINYIVLYFPHSEKTRDNPGVLEKRIGIFLNEVARFDFLYYLNCPFR